VNTPSKEPSIAPAQAAQTSAPLKPGSVFKDCEICPEMVVIPGGTFQMGSTATGFLGQTKPVSYETPQHSVSVKQFAIGKYEVTQEQWSAVMGTTPSRFTGTNLPVELVSWADANEYVKKLSEKTGKNYRLPTEAEWEYAARAGSQAAYSFGSFEMELEKFAWFFTGFNLNGKSTNPVGGKLPNGFGLFDVHGNVFEWTQDCWNINYEGAPFDGTAWTTGDCSRRVIRGGSWVTPREGLRSASRDRSLLEARQDHYGLRVVMAPK
jgi:formylglycine-generating enzyme required for sulfatase activity